MKKIILILLLTFLFPEEFIYSVGFKFLNVGQATISSSMNDNDEILINTLVKSNKVLDKLYRVRDEIKLIVNPDDFSLKKIDKDVLEGKWKKTYSATIDSNLNIVTESRIIENDKILFDPISIIYNLRNQELKKGNKYQFNVLGLGEVQPLTAEVIGSENIRVPSGKYKCFKVVPYSGDGKDIFKKNGYMTAWFSKDDSKIPVKIELKTNIGNLTLKLKKIIP
mgnify:CR=1 FL=1|tara:strand:- start:797 stop:1465 length:669 start_codon:yes stop_codon:yes gene_type:complete